MCIFLCRLTRKPILKSCLFLADCLHEDSHKPARSSQRSEYWPAEYDFKDMYVWSLCLSVCTSMSWGIIYWNRRGRIISHVPPPISDDEINGLKLRGGRGARGRRVVYYGTLEQRGTHVRCTYQSGDNHGEKNTIHRTGIVCCGGTSWSNSSHPFSAVVVTLCDVYVLVAYSFR